MSAKDRAQKRLEQADRKFVRSAMMGLTDALDSPNGRAYFWYFYAENANAEGDDGAGRRAVAREMLEAATIANWDGVQAMREENEKPPVSAREAMLSEADNAGEEDINDRA